jgi:acyl dehydratase
VAKLEPERTAGRVTLESVVMNQRAERVLEGEMTFLIQRRPPGAE